MSLLSFLRVVEEIQQTGSKNHVPPRTRRLAMEALEGRAVLTLLGSLAEPIQIVTDTIVAPVIESLPLDPAPTTEAPPIEDGGSGSGTGEPEPADPGSEPPPDNGGSGSGTGEPTEPLPDNGGSGSGIGGSPPIITSLESTHADIWVWFSGTVADTDGPVEGLTVYFSIGDTSIVSFTTTVGADGSFRTVDLMIDLGISIYAYTIDAQGNQSLIANCIA
jgi:hypothetical protein